MFGSIGMPELIIIFVIALIIFGPRKLPELGRSLGKSIGEFKRASNDLRNTLEEEIKVEEARTPEPAKSSADTPPPAEPTAKPSADTPPPAEPTAKPSAETPPAAEQAAAPAPTPETAPAAGPPTSQNPTNSGA